jgi:hypothetical protein
MKTLYETGAVKIVRLMSDADIDRLIRVFEEIAGELSWQPGDRIRAYRSRSVHFGVVVGGQLAGGLQLATLDASGALPYREVWPEMALPDCRSVSHVTILALRKEFRGRQGVFWPLCVELWRDCVVRGIDDIRLETTPDTLRLYRRIGWPLEIIGELREHWGEPCLLCRTGVNEVAASVMEKAGRSQSYRAVIDQSGRALPSEAAI